jgi:hypothetical protein
MYVVKCWISEIHIIVKFSQWWRALFCALLAHSIHRDSVVFTWSWYRHVINTTTHIGPSVLEIVELILIHRNSHHTILVDVIQMIWWLQQPLFETGNVIPMALVNVGCPWTVWTTVTEGVIIAAVKWQLWRSSHSILWKWELSQLRFLEVLLDQGCHAHKMHLA